MSTDPTGLDGEGCVEATNKQYINVRFDKSDWCEYDGECLIENMLIEKEKACMLCRYRKLIDVPWKLDLKMRERKKM